MIDIEALLGTEADQLLNYRCNTISRDLLHLPGPDYVGRVVAEKNRTTAVLRNMQSMFNHGRLANTAAGPRSHRIHFISIQRIS
jgi:class I fructose-bisphosphate aldolase